MASFLCKWFGIGCPKPVPVPVPPPAPTLRAVGVILPENISAWVYLDDVGGGHRGKVNKDGYVEFQVSNLPTSMIHIDADGFLPYQVNGLKMSEGNFQIRVGIPADPSRPQDVILARLTPRVAPLPAPPTRDQIIDVAITFQGLLVPTKQFGVLPWFESCLPWLTSDDRQAAYTAKKAAGDTHAIVHIPCGPALYDESGQPYNQMGPLDWTQGNTTIEPKLTDLIREVAQNGFSKILLYLGGDGSGDAYKIAFTQLELLAQNQDYRTTLYKYCAVVPGYDGVFYGWPLEEVMKFGLRFRQLFPDGHLALHYSIGHIPVGEGGDDYLPRRAGQDPLVNPGRMADYDLLLGEFDDNLHQDSCWQILNRLEADYKRPSDQPASDDPTRVYYLGTPNSRGRWGHCALEYGEYEFVRARDLLAAVAHVKENRAYLKSMGVKFVG